MISFLGIDLGLSGARAAVINRRGELLSSGRSTLRTTSRGEHDPEEWLDAVSEAVRASLASAGSPAVEAVAIGALGPCAVTVDSDLKPLGKASLFSLDTRAEPYRQKLLREGFAETEIGPDHVLPKLLRIRETEAERFAQTAYVLDATGFLVASLTGEPVMDEITSGDHMAQNLAPPRPLPPIRKADEIAGRVTREASRRFGIAENTPVCVGSYDSYVDLFGSGVSKPDDAGMLLGTTLVMGKVVSDWRCGDAPRMAPDGASRCGDALRITSLIGGGSFLGGWTSSAGSLIDWSASLLGESAASAASGCRPGSGGVLMLPYFSGERAPVWDPLARGALLGMTLGTTRGDLHRAAIDAVALSAMDLAQRIDQAAGPTPRYRVSGGGARNATLIDAIAAATGATLEIVAHSGEACAPAILAAHAMGISISPAIDREVHPDLAFSGIYDRLLEIYHPLYGKLAEAMHALGALAREAQ